MRIKRDKPGEFSGTKNYFNPVKQKHSPKRIDSSREEDIILENEESESQVSSITVSTVSVEAETILSPEEVSREKKERDKKNFGDNNKRVHLLPWKEMFNFYVRGERVIKGGIKHTTYPTYREVAERFNCAPSTVGAYAGQNNWVAKRKRYREKLSSEFSFPGQLAADINTQVLNCSSVLVRKITSKLNDPAFLPCSEDIIAIEGNFYVRNYVEDPMAPPVTDLSNYDLLPVPGGLSKNTEVADIEKITKSLESINRICNNTVQVEIENSHLLDELQQAKDTAEAVKQREARIEELKKRIEGTKRKRKLTNKEKTEKALAAKTAKAEKSNK